MNLIELSLKACKVEDLKIGQKLIVVGYSKIYNKDPRPSWIEYIQAGDIVTIGHQMNRSNVILEKCSDSACEDFGPNACPYRRNNFRVFDKDGKPIWSCYLLLKTLNGIKVT